METAVAEDVHEPNLSVIEYNVTDAAIEELKKECSGLKITDSKSYKKVKVAISEVRGLRVSVEKKRKELKADALKWGRQVDAEANRIKELLLPIENELKATKKAEDDRKAEIKAEKERKEKERIEGIRSKIAGIQDMALKVISKPADQLRCLYDQVDAHEITPEEYMEFAPEAIHVQKNVLETIQKAYDDRVKADKEEAERKAEAEKLKKQKKEQEAEQKRLEAERKKIDEEKAKLKADKKALKKTEEKVEVEQSKEPEPKNPDPVSTQKATSKEPNPDRDKLVKFANSLLDIKRPQLKDPNALKIAREAIEDIFDIGRKVHKLAEAL